MNVIKWFALTVFLICLTTLGQQPAFLTNGLVAITNVVVGKGIILGTGTYQTGTTITLRAVPQVDWRFDHWEGVSLSIYSNNPIAIEATIGLRPQAIFQPSKGAGRFTGGLVEAWGNNEVGQTMVPSSATNIVAISAGFHHSLALGVDGNVTGWGRNEYNQATIPSEVIDAVSVAAGEGFSLVLSSEGKVHGWGRNQQEQSTFANEFSDVHSIAAGGYHSLALRADGSVVGSVTNSIPIPSNLRNVVEIAPGWSFNLGLRADGTLVGSSPGAIPSNLQDVVAISAGWHHCLALRSNGSVVGWGSDDQGQSTIPDNLGYVVAIAAGAYHSLALRIDGTVVGWGGRGVSFDRGQAIIPSGLKSVVSIAGGFYHNLALKSDNFGVIRSSTKQAVIEEFNTQIFTTQIAGATNHQWYKDGAPLIGESYPWLVVANASAANSGVYQLLAIKNNEGVLTEPSLLKVLPVGAPKVFANGKELINTIKVGDRALVTLMTSFPSGQIFYSLDGSVPTIDSKPYIIPFTVTNSVVIRAYALSSDFTQEAVNDPVSIQIVPTFSLDINVTGQGRIDRKPTIDRYLQDDVISIKAVPNEGWRFVRWEGDLTGSFAERNIAISRDKSVRAIFETIPQFIIGTTGKGGTATGGGTYYQGTAIQLSAQDALNWNFLGWTGDYVGSETNFSWMVDGSATFEAKFGTKVSTLATGAGKVVLEPNLPIYTYGTKVKVIPLPDSGNYLTLWGEAGTGQPKTEWVLTVTNAQPRVTALFRPLALDKVALTTQSTLGGSIQQPNVDGLYAKGTSVVLTPVAEAGYEFTSWSGDASGSENPLTVVLDSSKTVKAGFRRVGVASYPVTVAIVGPGTVRRVPDLGAYEAGSEVELVAETTGSALFAGWTGAVSSSQKRVRISVNGPMSATATFKAVYPVATEVRGEGQILLSPPDANYSEGTAVALTAKPAEGWGFVQWSGDIVTTTQEAGVTVDAPKRVIAEFARLGTLTTKVLGSGTVSRTPEGQSFLPGTTVTLTAQAQAGWRFLRWSGGASGTSATTSVVVGRTEAIVAEFTDGEPPVLTVTQPVSGAVEDQRFSLSGTASDAVGLRGISWAWNGISQGDLPLSAGGFSVGNLNLSMGTNLIEVTAEDAAGNVSVVRREVVWKPIRTLIAGSAVEVQEGHRMTFPLSMVSTGDVGGLTFKLTYNAAFLTDPKVEWSAVVGQSVNSVNTSVAGEISGSFSLPGTALASGTAALGTVDFRARSVPAQTNVVLSPAIASVANPSGTLLATGNGAVAGEGRIRPRKIKGDNNANQRIDIGDAVVVSRLLVGSEETRSWDIGLNDLNASLSLDNGDVIKALRTVVGLDPQPSPGSEGKRLAMALGLAKVLVNTNDAMGIELLDGPKATVGQPYRVAVRLNRVKGNLSGLSFTMKYPASLTLTDKQVGAMVPGDALPFWNESAGQVSLAAIRSTAWANATGVAAVLTFVPSAAFSGQAEWPLKLEQVEITGSGFDVRPVDPVAVVIQSGGGTVNTPPQISLQPPKADGSMTLEILATQGATVAVETTGDLNTWVEIQQVTGQGNSTPVKITLQTDPNVQAKFWRVRVR